MIGGVPVDRHSALAIELDGLTRYFGAERVLDAVDLAVPTGTITVLLGPSGAGKTVTINHIVGLLQPSAGSVRVEGKDLAAISEAELNEIRRGMGVVQQGSLPFTCGLFYSLDVLENVAFPLRERTSWSDETIERVAIEHLGMVGMREHVHHMPDELSAGMAKRAALARALALDPRIVIVDDFDSGLDGVRLALLCELLGETQRSSGATFLVTTHDMSAARTLADHVAVIHRGRIVASGEADAVFASSEPLVRQLLAGGLAGPIQLEES